MGKLQSDIEKRRSSIEAGLVAGRERPLSAVSQA